MARGSGEPKRPAFGRIDPVCWVVVILMMPAAAGMFLVGLFEVGIAVVVLAALLLLFDARINRPGKNRPEIEDDRRPPARPRAAAPKSGSGRQGARPQQPQRRPAPREGERPRQPQRREPRR